MQMVLLKIGLVRKQSRNHHYVGLAGDREFTLLEQNPGHEQPRGRLTVLGLDILLSQLGKTRVLYHEAGLLPPYGLLSSFLPSY